MPRIGIIFLFAFVTNWIWENLHSFLYSNYIGGEITQAILVQASLIDAVIILAILFPYLYIEYLQDKKYIIFIVGVLVSISIEIFALNTGQWQYNSYMPIIPILKTGLTPTIQLGLLGYITYVVMKKLEERGFIK